MLQKQRERLKGRDQLLVYADDFIDRLLGENVNATKHITSIIR
jgi:hypothetical protein